MSDDRRPGAPSPAAAEVLSHLQAFAEVGFWEYDLRTRSLYLSTQVFELLGIDAPCVDDYLAVVHPEDLSMLRQVHHRARAQPGPYRVRHRTADAQRVLELRMQSVGDEAGVPRRYLGVISDVTAEWQLEQALELSSAARLTGILAGGALHDLKNVFAVLLGHAQLLRGAEARGAAPDPESLAALERAAERGLDLASRLLQVGRAEPVTARRVCVAQLFRRVEVTGKTVLGGYGRLRVDAGAGGVDVVADESRLERVLVDLMLNARDALPPTGGSVAVAFRPLGPDEVDDLVDQLGIPSGTYGAVEVTDTGSGIAADVLAKVTDPFFTTKARAGGTGVGLHTVARFVEQAGGVLRIESEVGEGTTVRMVLPTRPAVPVARRRRSAVRAVVHGADDERVTALVEAIEAIGVQVVASSSTRFAAALLRTEPIDLLVCDVTRPRGDADLLRVAGATSTPVLGVGEVLGPAAALDPDDLQAVASAVDRMLERPGQRVRA